MSKENRAVTVFDAEGMKDAIADVRSDAIKARRDRALAGAALARENDVDDSIVQRLKNGEVRPFSRRKRYQFATAGTPSTIVDFSSSTYQPNPFATGKSEQTEDDGVLYIDAIGIELEGDMKLNTYEKLREQFGVKIHYPGTKKPRVIPLASVLEAGNVHAIDAGNNAGTAVAGTHHSVRPPTKYLRFTDDEKLVVNVKESSVRLEFFRLPAFSSNPALTGETAALYWNIDFEGEKLSVNHEQS